MSFYENDNNNNNNMQHMKICKGVRVFQVKSVSSELFFKI